MIGLRLIVIIMAIDLSLYIGGFLPVPVYAGSMGFEIVDNETYGNTSTSYGLFTANATVTQQSFTTYNDPLGFIFGTISFIFTTFAFAPLSVVMSLGSPLIIQLMVGVVWSVMWVVAVMSFIRGSDF